MKTPKFLLLSGAALGSALLLSTTPVAPPAAGPGGVIEAVRDFVQAMDQGDVDYMNRALTAEIHGVECGIEDGKIVQSKRVGAPVFFDVSVDGQLIAALDPSEFTKKLRGGVTTSKAHALETSIRSIRADCPSGNCSYAIVEFDRLYTAGGTKTRVPMRATVLVRHQSASTPNFEIFHWNAARAGEPEQIGKTAKGKPAK